MLRQPQPASRGRIAAILGIVALAFSLPAASAGAEAVDPTTEVAPGVHIAPVSDAVKGEPAPTSQPDAKRITNQTRIVGGGTTTIAEWPWQVAITADPEFFSGNAFSVSSVAASLVAPTIVVSAAHCFFNVFQGVPGQGFDPPTVRGDHGPHTNSPRAPARRSRWAPTSSSSTAPATRCSTATRTIGTSSLRSSPRRRPPRTPPRSRSPAPTRPASGRRATRTHGPPAGGPSRRAAQERHVA